MNRLAMLAALAAACVLSSSCGGGGLLVFSPFEGTWSGTWAGGAADGTVSFTVDTLGDLSGTMHSDTADVDGPLQGVIANDGDTTVTVAFPGAQPELGIGTLTLSGDGTTLGGTLDFAGDLVAFDLAKT